MNQTSLAKTIPDPSKAIEATLDGYVRKCNAAYNGYLYMNIIPKPSSSITGVMVPITDAEFASMQEREVGYEAIDVTECISPAVAGQVIVFVAPDVSYPELQIPSSYLATCTRDMSDLDRERWIEETIIENDILEDMDNPVYANVAV